MKHFVLAAVFAVFAAPAAHASSVIDCSGSASAINSCVASQLPSFETRLDWAVFGTPNGAIYNGAWTVPDILPSGLDLTVKPQGAYGSFEGLVLAYNMASVYMGGEWLPASLPANQPYSFGGHFNAPPDPSFHASHSVAQDPGDHLIGLALDGTSQGSAQHNLVLDFSSGVTDVAFRVSSVHDTDFTVRVRVFAGLDGTGNLLSDQVFTYYGVGGTCSSLFVDETRLTPAACNDAPMLAALGFHRGAQSIVISTTDPRGFYIDTLFVNEAPEPATVILSGCGILAIVARRRGWLRTV